MPVPKGSKIPALTAANRAKRLAIIEEVEWVIENGSSPDEVCVQLDCRPTALTRSLYRWGRADLARHFTAICSMDREGRWTS